MADTIHAQLAAALRKFAQAAEREGWVRRAVPGPTYNVAHQEGRDRVRIAELELDMAVIVSKAAADEVASLIIDMHRTKTVPT